MLHSKSNPTPTPMRPEKMPQPMIDRRSESVSTSRNRKRLSKNNSSPNMIAAAAITEVGRPIHWIPSACLFLWDAVGP